MKDFFGKLGLKYERSGMPGAKQLNGPQIDKVWKYLDLLHEMLMEKGAGVIGDGHAGGGEGHGPRHRHGGQDAVWSGKDDASL